MVPRFATLARATEGTLGETFVVARSPYGMGLFAMRDIAKGEVISEYAGERSAEDPRRTHALRIPESDIVIDGSSARRRLHRVGMRFEPDVVGDVRGYAALANSSLHPNAAVRWTFDDIGQRAPGYDPRTQRSFPLWKVLPKRPFLVASRRITRGTEITWRYQVEIDDDDTVISYGSLG